MRDTDKKENNLEQKSTQVKEENKAEFKNRVGNILLLILIFLIFGTGSLTYYLNSALFSSLT